MNTIRAAKTQWLSGVWAVLNGLVQWHFSIVFHWDSSTLPFRPLTVPKVTKIEGIGSILNRHIL